jgi:uncharacterized membrane protein YGL010W
MATLDTWFERYGESHRHPINRALHTVCVPLIAVSLVYLLGAVPSLPGMPAVSWSACVVGAVLIWYARLSIRHAVGIAAVALVIRGALSVHPGLTTVPVMAGVFVAAWVGQFIGHQIEGRRPSFIDDLRFLLVGPLWVLDGVYRRIGLSR